MQSYRNLDAQWVPANAANFTIDREGHSPTPPFYVIYHTTVGSIASAVGAFQSPTRRASAHYIVGLDGSLTQMVDEKDAAWHAGNYGINLDSIGIEHEDGGNYNSPRPPALKQTSARLLADICTRYGLTCDRTVVRKHKEVSDAPTACPDSLEVDEIVGMAQALLHPTTNATAGSEVTVPEEEDMILFRSTERGPDTNQKIYVLEDGHKRHLSGDEWALWEKAGVKIVDVDAALLAPIPEVPTPTTVQITKVSGTWTGQAS